MRTFLPESNEIPDLAYLWAVFFFLIEREDGLLALCLPVFTGWPKQIILFQKSDSYETEMYFEQGSR